MTMTLLPRLAVAATPVAAAAAVLAGILDLPTGLVTADYQSWHGPIPNAVSTVDVSLSNVPAGFDVGNGLYAGWCMEDNHRDNGENNSQVLLFDSTAPDTELPASFQGLAWDKVNYVLNHKAGHNVVDVQVAIWILVGYYDGTFGGPSPTAQQLINDAHTNGDGFVPGPDEIAAVLVYNDGMGPTGVQDVLIEVTVPGSGDEGLTPGYWKNHPCAWGPTELRLCDDFDSVFGVDYFRPNITLYQALCLGGGHVEKVARHGTAALLNARHPGVDYPYSEAEVIAFVRAGNVEPLVEANELGGEIDLGPRHCNRRGLLRLFLHWAAELRRGRHH